MNRIVSSAVAAVAAVAMLTLATIAPAKADSLYCSGYAAGYKAAYCSKATRLSSCNPQAVDCNPLAGDGYPKGYMAGQADGLAGEAPKKPAEQAKPVKPGG